MRSVLEAGQLWPLLTYLLFSCKNEALDLKIQGMTSGEHFLGMANNYKLYNYKRSKKN